jgi:hypothetical protein
MRKKSHHRTIRSIFPTTLRPRAHQVAVVANQMTPQAHSIEPLLVQVLATTASTATVSISMPAATLRAPPPSDLATTAPLFGESR